MFYKSKLFIILLITVCCISYFLIRIQLDPPFYFIRGENNIKIFNILLNEHNVNKQIVINEGGFLSLTPLMISIEKNDKRLFDKCIQLQAKVNVKIDHFYTEHVCLLEPTALHIAIAMDRMDMAKDLIKSGADIEARLNANAYTPLMLAAHLENEEMIKLLLTYGADVEAKTEGPSLWETNIQGLTAVDISKKNQKCHRLLLKARALQL